MTEQSQASAIKQKLLAQREKGTPIKGSDVLSYLQPASEAGVEVITPTGVNRALPAVLIGSDRRGFLYFTLYTVSANEAALCCRPGYRVAISLVCERGMGAMVHFSSFIEQFSSAPLVFTVRTPESLLLSKIRKETRYPVQCEGLAVVGQRQVEISLLDLSQDGCAFATNHMAPPFSPGWQLELRFRPATRDATQFRLTGTLCNLRTVGGQHRYGMRFDAHGRQQSARFFEHLEFDGHHMVIRTLRQQTRQ
ncbi:PilZ domain-containing protein [Aeromonas schubertii]